MILRNAGAIMKLESQINKHLGQKYYSVMDVLKGKLTSLLLENSRELSIEIDTVKKIDSLLSLEIDSAKSWGYDQLKVEIDE